MLEIVTITPATDLFVKMKNMFTFLFNFLHMRKYFIYGNFRLHTKVIKYMT